MGLLKYTHPKYYAKRALNWAALEARAKDLGLLRSVLLLAILATLAMVSSASANYHSVIRDCAQDGKLNHHYSRADLKKALNRLPTDIREYTDCYGVIAAALLNSDRTSTCGHSTATKLRIKLATSLRGRVVRLDAYVNGHHVVHKKGHSIRCLVIKKPKGTKPYKVKIVALTANGWKTTSARVYRR